MSGVSNERCERKTVVTHYDGRVSPPKYGICRHRRRDRRVPTRYLSRKALPLQRKSCRSAETSIRRVIEKETVATCNHTWRVLGRPSLRGPVHVSFQKGTGIPLCWAMKLTVRVDHCQGPRFIIRTSMTDVVKLAHDVVVGTGPPQSNVDVRTVKWIRSYVNSSRNSWNGVSPTSKRHDPSITRRTSRGGRGSSTWWTMNLTKCSGHQEELSWREMQRLWQRLGDMNCVVRLLMLLLCHVTFIVLLVILFLRFYQSEFCTMC